MERARDVPGTMSQDAVHGTNGPRVLDIERGLDALRSSPTFRGPVEPLEGHDSNEHLALIYETRDEQFSAVVPFLQQGLERGERCMYVVDESSRADVLAAMRAADVDVEGALESGALTFHTVQETYLRDGAFDPDGMISFYADAIEDATAEYEALRVCAETTWILEEETTIEKFMEYESRVNELFRDEDCIALCQYDRTQVPPDVLCDVIRTHPHLIYDGTVCHNFYYTPPEAFFGPDQPDREVDRMLGTLVDRTRAKAALEEREEYLRRQNDVTADPDLSFEEKLQELFELGCERFELELGAMARVDPETDYFEIEYTSGDEYFEPGVTMPLSETYCTAVTDGRGVAGVTDPFGGGYINTTVHEEFGLKTYLGAHIPVEGDLDRTFFFVSSTPRDEEFSDEELTFHRLLSQWVKYELDHRRRERDQRTLYEIAADADRTFEEKLQGLFDLGCTRFDLELGGIARVDPGTDYFEVETVSGEHEHLVPGAQVALSETYCRVVADGGGTAGITDPANDGFEGTVAHDEFGVRAYLGTRIEVDGDYDRTLFFVTTEPRKRAFSEAQRTFHHLMGQWVRHELERIHREERLTALNEMSRELTAAETPSEIADCVVEYAQNGLGLPVTAVAYYDEETGELSTAAQTASAEDGLPTATLSTPGAGAAWDAFVLNEPRFVDIEDGRASPIDDAAIGEIAAIPLARHGVFLTASPTSGGFVPGERDFLGTVTASVESVLTRAERTRLLRERDRDLESRNETLQRLNRVNGIIRNIDQALVRASTRSEIEDVVCAELARTGPYDLAWVGGYDAVTGEVSPREWDGDETAHPDVTVGTDDELTPIAEAIAAREPRTIDNVLTDPPLEEWQKRALDRGYRSMIALPLVYKQSLYGVLTVYASQPGVFDDLEGAVLEELSDTIAYAIHVVESKRAIVDDALVELEFDVRNLESDVLDLVEETGGEFTFESVVPGANGGLRWYFSIHGAAADEVTDAARRLHLPDVTPVTERETVDGPECLFEATLEDDCSIATVLEHGATPRELTVGSDGARLVVELSTRADVRRFVERFRNRHPGAELAAKRERERATTTRQEFETALVRELTDRQLEVLKTAYASGFFESPRARTGTEIAETLDITQPTFNTHLRAAHRKLYALLFENDAPTDGG